MSYTAPTAEEVQARRADLAPFDSLNERIWLSMYATILAWSGIPKSYLDLGSGTGAMVNMAQRIGVEAWGVDVINGPEHWFINHDLTKPLFLEEFNDHGEMMGVWKSDYSEYHSNPIKTFDLITCLEVAEHLPEAAADTLCDSIERHMRKGSLLVFSAANPGQGGEHHQNLQPAWYWRSKFHALGVSYREDYTRQLSHLWSWVAGPLQWVPANVQVFDY
jgi:2-polyprenyl-3-methyl-5-hydroxy-6-metoxy-1,4-benzoquinol methylase